MRLQDSTPFERFYTVGGTLDWDAPSYVRRSADTTLLETLRQGELCYVLDTRQVGKSSLLVRTAARLLDEGIDIVQLDISKQGRNVDPESWYLGLLYQFAEPLGLLTEAETFWGSHKALSPVQRWFEAIRLTILQQRDSPLIAFIDEIDSVRGLPFSADEFFSSIRAVTQTKSQHPQWRWLTFCFAGAATPAQLTQDVRATPFNIGRRIELTDFTESDALPLSQGFTPTGIGVRTSLIQRIIHWTGGHPYLTQRLCYEVARAGITQPDAVDQLCRDTFLDRRARETDPNLHFVRERLLRSDEVDRYALLQLYAGIRRGRVVRYDPTSELANALRLAGLVLVQDGRLLVRNRIYAEQFNQAWIKESQSELPDTAARRAYWRGFRRAAALSILFLFTAGAAIWSKFSERDARTQASIERGQKLRLSSEIGQKQAALDHLTQVKQNQETQIQGSRRTLHSLDAKRRQGERELKRIRQLLVQAQSATNASIQDRDTVRSEMSRANEHSAKITKQAKASARLAEEASRKLLSTLSHHQGSERDALALGISVLKPLLLSGIPPQREVLQNIADVVNQGATRLQQISQPWRTSCATLSPTGKTLVTAGEGTELIVWNPVTRKRLQSVTAYPNGGSGSPLYTVVYSPVESPERFLAEHLELLTGAQDGKLRLWRVKADETLDPQPRIIEVEAPPTGNRRPTMLQACFSPDGKEIACTAYDANQRYGVAIFERATGKRRTWLGSFPDSFWSIAWSSDGKLLAMACNNGAVELWDTKTAKQTQILASPNERKITSLKFVTADMLLCGDSDGRVNEWVTSPVDRRFRQTNTYQGAKNTTIWALDANPHRLMVTGDNRGRITLWHLGSPEKPLMTLETQTGSLIETRFLPAYRSNREFVFTTAGQGKTVEIWHVNMNAYATEQGPALSAAFSADGLQLIMGDAGGLLRRRAVAPSHPGSRIELAILADPGHPRGAVTAVALSPDATLLASGITNGNIRIWDATQQRVFVGDASSEALVCSLTDRGGDVHALCFSPSGKLLASSGRGAPSTEPGGQEFLRLWDISNRQTSRPLRRWRIPTGDPNIAPPNEETFGYQIYSAEFTHDGSELICGAEDGGVYIADVAQDGFRQKLRPVNLGRGIAATDACPSPDGRFIAACYSDGSIRLWNRENESVIATISAQGPVNSVALSLDGKWLATAGKDAAVKLWSLPRIRRQGASLDPDLILNGHVRSVLSVRFSPDSQRVITASVDGTVRIFPVTAQEYLAEAKALLNYQPAKPFPFREKMRREANQ